jgi:hypothetical protein
MRVVGSIRYPPMGAAPCAGAAGAGLAGHATSIRIRSTRFFASSVSYLTFRCSRACMLSDQECADLASGGAAIREGVMERPCRRRGRQRTHEVASKKKLPEKLE